MLIKMRAELANLNHCTVLFLRRAVINLSWYDIIIMIRIGMIYGMPTQLTQYTQHR